MTTTIVTIAKTAAEAASARRPRRLRPRHGVALVAVAVALGLGACNRGASTPSTAQSAAAGAGGQGSKAASWRGKGVTDMKRIFRIYLGRRPSASDAAHLASLAKTPDRVMATLLDLFGKPGKIGPVAYADQMQAAFERRVDGFLNGTQAAAMRRFEGGGLGLTAAAHLDPNGDLEAILAPKLKASNSGRTACPEANSARGCFAAWLAAWIDPTEPPKTGVVAHPTPPVGRSYFDILRTLATAH